MDTVKRILIMGATSGIGLELAKLCIAKGWRVGIAGRRAEPLEKLRQSAPSQVVAGCIDVTRESSAADMLQLVENMGGMDIYCHVSGIGAQNPTLDPASPDFKWTDHGKIIQSVPNRDMWNAIDPNIIVDEDGTPWMNFGSFWDGIKMVKLTKDMMQVAQPEEWYSLCRRERSFELDDKDPGDGAVEAPFIMKHGDYYYLFVSFDYCCRGLKSNYKVVVGRSKSVTGPYVDKEGKSMAKGGGSLVIQGNKDYAGVGHNAAYRLDGKDYFLCHAYSVAEDGASKLIIREMTWTSDGWPVVNW